MKKIESFMLAILLMLLTQVAYSQIVPGEIPDSVFTRNVVGCGITPQYLSSLGIIPGTPASPAVAPGGGGASISTFTAPNVFPAYAIEHCGKFDVYYEDLLIASPFAGFKDPTLGAARRNTLCAVLTYVQSVFDFSSIPAGSPIRLHVAQSFAPVVNPAPLTATYLAFAGPTFINTGLPHLINGFVFDYTTTGIDPGTAAQYHAEVTVNFDQAYDSFGTPIPINWHDDYTLPIANCKYDLFSVLLHEVGHTLGWLSYTHKNTGTGFPESILGGNQFSGIDFGLQKGTVSPLSLNPLIVGTPLTPSINPLYAASTTALTSNDIWISPFAAPDNHPVYSGLICTPWTSTFALGSILSHMDDQMWLYTSRARISPGDNCEYVMGPFGVKGILRRKFTDVEINTLSNIGYPINTTYVGIPNLSNLPPYSTRMAGYTTMFNNDFAESVAADFAPLVNNTGAFLTINLATDPTLIDPEGNPISVAPGSLVNIRGCGNGGNNHNQLVVSGGGQIITYTPRPNFYGRAQFGLKLFDGSEQGSYVIYTIDVLKGTAVSCAAGSNIILNGNLEEGTEVKQLGPEEIIDASQQDNNFLREGKVRQGIQFGDCQPYNFLSNNWGPFGAGDMVKDSRIDCSGTIYRSSAGSWNTTFPFGGSAPNPLASGGVGERYKRIYGNHNYFNLCSDMQTCKQYVLEFDYFAQPAYTSTGTNIPLTVGFTNATAFPASSALTYSFVQNFTVTAGSWQHLIIPFTYCGTTPASILNLRQTVAWLGFFTDNFELKEVTTPPPPLGVIITPTTPTVCLGSSVTLSSTLTNALCNVTYSWSPTLATTPSITVTPAVTTVYTLTVNDGCRTTVVSTTVVVNVPNITATASPTTVISGGPSVLTTNATGAVWTPGGPGSTITVFPTTTTVYTVTGNDPINGCPGTATVTVTVVPGCTAPPGATSIPPIGANSSAYPLGFTAVASTVAINGNFTVNTPTFTISGINNVRMAANTKIIILPGSTLTITSCRIYSCLTQMWDGIEIRPGGKLIMTITKVEDAKIAVLSQNNSTATILSDFYLERNQFNRNYIAVKVENYPFFALHPGTIRNCLFDSQPSTTSTVNTSILDSPYSTQSAEFGVELNNVNLINIGDASSSGYLNRFRYLRVGIRAQSSIYNVYNNDFRNNFPTPFCVTPFPTPPGFSCPAIGWAIWNTKTKCVVGGYLANQPNNFQDLTNGIIHESGDYLDVFKNTFKNITSSSLLVNSIAVFTKNFNQGTITINDNDIKDVEIGLKHLNNTNTTYIVKANLFKNFTQSGITAVQNTSGTIGISLNDYNQSATSIFNGNIAINISNAVMPLSSSPNVGIKNNTIYRVNKGVYLTDINRPNVSNNNIGFKSSITPLTPNFYYGIRAQNGNLEFIYQNVVWRSTPLPTSAFENSVYGISIETNSTQTGVLENTVQRMGTGLRFRSYSNANSSVRCNIMTQNWSGLTLDAVNIGPQGQSAVASPPFGISNDNNWSNPAAMVGSLSTHGLGAYTVADFYTRSAAYPWTPSFVSSFPLLTVKTVNTLPVLAGGLVSSAPANCTNICYNPPCLHAKLAQIARNQNPFNLVVDPVTISMMQEGVLRSVLADSIPPDTATIDGHDLQMFVDTSLVNNNMGRLVDVSQTYAAGDTTGAVSKNSAIDPKNCAESYHKIVNEIFFRTWAKGIFDLPTDDYNTLAEIAGQDPLLCGTAIYDARVMTEIDVNDFSPDMTFHSMEINPGDAVQDIVGVLYPNPAENACTYEAELAASQSGMIMMFDLNGKLLSSYKLLEGMNKIDIDLSNYSNGIYLYKIEINGEVVDYKKLVIAK